MHLAREPRLRLGQFRCRGRPRLIPVEGVRVPSLDGLHRLIRAATNLDDDLVGISVGLRRLRPLVEVLVALERQQTLRPVRRNDIRPSRRQRVGPGLPRRDSGGHGVGERKRELVEELGVGPGEMERHRVCAGDDSFREIAALWRLHARLSADNLLVERAPGRFQREDALERVADIGGLDERAGRIANVRPQPEAVRLSGIGRRRKRDCQVGDDLRPFAAPGTHGPDEAVPGHVHDRPSQGVVGNRRVDRECPLDREGPGRTQRQRAPAVTRARLEHAHEHAAVVGDRYSLWAVADLDSLHDPLRGRIDPDDGPAELVAHPDSARTDGQRGRAVPDLDRVRYGPCGGVDARDRPVEAVRHPDGAVSERKPGGAVADRDGLHDVSGRRVDA